MYMFSFTFLLLRIVYIMFIKQSIANTELLSKRSLFTKKNIKLHKTHIENRGDSQL